MSVNKLLIYYCTRLQSIASLSECICIYVYVCVCVCVCVNFKALKFSSHGQTYLDSSICTTLYRQLHKITHICVCVCVCVCMRVPFTHWHIYRHTMPNTHAHAHTLTHTRTHSAFSVCVRACVCVCLCSPITSLGFSAAAAAQFHLKRDGKVPGHFFYEKIKRSTRFPRPPPSPSSLQPPPPPSPLPLPT